MKLMVIDGNSLINRAFYGIRMLTTKDGQPTNAVYGFVNILLKLLDEEKPDALCVTFDRKAPTFRHLAYEGYKAQRKGMPDELAAQMPVLKEVLAAMNIPRYETGRLGGRRPDGHHRRSRIPPPGGDTVIVTGDKDSLQLVTDTPRSSWSSTRMGQTTTKDMTPDDLSGGQYGFDPIHIIDLKALMGDASDNIPGVKGIGEKTAMALLVQRYPTRGRAIYADLDQRGGQARGAQKAAPRGGAGPDVLRPGHHSLRCAHGFSPEDACGKSWNDPALYELFCCAGVHQAHRQDGPDAAPGRARTAGARPR
ncbi:MAG: 5'-3' exonuclease H3TH domain-containing protein [Flavonifractor plautii]